MNSASFPKRIEHIFLLSALKQLPVKSPVSRRYYDVLRSDTVALVPVCVDIPRYRLDSSRNPAISPGRELFCPPRCFVFVRHCLEIVVRKALPEHKLESLQRDIFASSPSRFQVQCAILYLLTHSEKWKNFCVHLERREKKQRQNEQILVFFVFFVGVHAE